MTECNKDCANYKPIETPEPSPKQPCFRCVKCGAPGMYRDVFGQTYCPECAKLAKARGEAGTMLACQNTSDRLRVKEAEIAKLNKVLLDRDATINRLSIACDQHVQTEDGLHNDITWLRKLNKAAEVENERLNNELKATIERLNAPAPSDKECERLAQVAASKSLQWPTDSIPYADFSRIATLLRSMKRKRVEWELKDKSTYFHIADLTWTFDSLDGCCIRQLLAHLGIESVERKEKQA